MRKVHHEGGSISQATSPQNTIHSACHRRLRWCSMPESLASAKQPTRGCIRQTQVDMTSLGPLNGCHSTFGTAVERNKLLAEDGSRIER